MSNDDLNTKEDVQNALNDITTKVAEAESALDDNDLQHVEDTVEEIQTQTDRILDWVGKNKGA